MEHNSTPERENDSLLYETITFLQDSNHNSSVNQPSKLDQSSILSKNTETDLFDDIFGVDVDMNEENDIEFVINDKVNVENIPENDTNNESKILQFGSTSSQLCNVSNLDNSIPNVNITGLTTTDTTIPITQKSTTTQIVKLGKSLTNLANNECQNVYQMDNNNSNNISSKPWNQPGADITDYFNYGFNEETWKQYCEKQKIIKIENLSSSNTYGGNVGSNLIPTLSTNTTLTQSNTTQSTDILNQMAKLIPDNKINSNQKLLPSVLPNILNIHNILQVEKLLSIENLTYSAKKCNFPSEIAKAFLIMALSGVDLPPNIRIEPPPSDFSIPSVDSTLLYNQMQDLMQSVYQMPPSVALRDSSLQNDNQHHFKRSYQTSKEKEHPSYNNNLPFTNDSNDSNRYTHTHSYRNDNSYRNNSGSRTRIDSKLKDDTSEKYSPNRDKSYKESSTYTRSKRSPSFSTSKYQNKYTSKSYSSNVKRYSRSPRRSTYSRNVSNRRRHHRSSSYSSSERSNSSSS